MASAGASLIPSPTIATRCPVAWSARTRSALSAGRTSATTWSAAIPAASAIAAAVRRWSPVIIHGSRPRPRNAATASPAPGFSASARVMRPRKVPSRATRMDVPPRAAAASTATSAPLISTPWSARSAGPPTSTVAPSTTAVAPRPAMAWKSFGVPSARCRSPAARTTATPSGCSDASSTLAASRSSSSSPMPATGASSVRAGRPTVSVPVLSSTMVSIERAPSSASPPRMRIPCAAAAPVPAMIAAGVASPSAQGQAMMSTAMRRRRQREPASLPSRSHVAVVSSAATMTSGTKASAMRSTRRWIGAFEPCASVTRRTIWASAVSAPTCRARMTKLTRRVQRRPDDVVAGSLVDRQALAGDHALVERGVRPRGPCRRRARARRAAPARGRRRARCRSARRCRRRRARPAPSWAGAA